MSEPEYFTDLIVSALVIIVNLIEMYLISERRRHITTYEALLLSLSAADFLVGVSTLVFTVGRNEAISAAISIGSQMFYSTLTSSLLHLAALTIDRAIAVAYPLKHRYWASKTRIAISIILLWIISIAFSLPLVFMHDVSTYKKTVLGYSMLVVSGVMVISYAIIIYIAVIRRRQQLQTSTGNRSNQQRNEIQKDLRLVLMSFTVVLSYTGLTLPFVIKIIEVNAKNKTTQRGSNYYERLAFITNSVMNSLIYFFWKFLEQRTARKRKRAEKNRALKVGQHTQANQAAYVGRDKASSVEETAL